MPADTPMANHECACGHAWSLHTEGSPATNMETGAGFRYEGCQDSDCDCPFIWRAHPRPEPAERERQERIFQRWDPLLRKLAGGAEPAEPEPKWFRGKVDETLVKEFVRLAEPAEREPEPCPHCAKEAEGLREAGVTDPGILKVPPRGSCGHEPEMPVPEPAAGDPLGKLAIRTVDNWECVEQETMREGHRANMERQIRAAFERLVRECADAVLSQRCSKRCSCHDCSVLDGAADAILARYGLKEMP